MTLGTLLNHSVLQCPHCEMRTTVVPSSEGCCVNSRPPFPLNTYGSTWCQLSARQALDSFHCRCLSCGFEIGRAWPRGSTHAPIPLLSWLSFIRCQSQEKCLIPDVTSKYRPKRPGLSRACELCPLQDGSWFQTRRQPFSEGLFVLELGLGRGLRGLPVLCPDPEEPWPQLGDGHCSGLNGGPQKLQPHRIPGTCDHEFIWKKDLCSCHELKDLEMSSCWTLNQ